MRIMRWADIICMGDCVELGLYRPESRYRRAINYRHGRRRFSLVHESLGAGPDRIVIADHAWSKWWWEIPPCIRISRRHVETPAQRYLRQRIPVFRSSPFHAMCVPDTLAQLKELLRYEAPRESLIGLWTGPRDGAGPFEQRLFERMSKAASRLMASLEGPPTGRAPTQAALAAQQMAGLGYGLTPSGDDFLAGVFYALHTWAPSAFTRRWLFALKTALRSAHGLSAHFLALAAAGRAPHALREIVAALAAGRAADMRQWARRVMSWGATSGADLLVGFVMTTEALSKYQS